MKRLNLVPAALFALTACLAWAQSANLPARSADIPAASSEQLRAAYLECDRVTSTTSVGPDYMSACAEIGAVLMHRDFGGDLQRQLEWWRSARTAMRPEQEAHVAPESLR
jgi:hypothetical protein